MLIEHGAGIDAEDREGRAPFQVAQKRDMVELLLDNVGEVRVLTSVMQLSPANDLEHFDD